MDIKSFSADDLRSPFVAQLFQILRRAEQSSRRKGEKPETFCTPRDLVISFRFQHHMRLINLQGGPQFVTTPMPRSYLPCTESIEDLTPILIKDLRLETHHRGRKIFIRMLTPPTRMNAVMAIVEDLEGLAVVLQLYQLPEESILPASSVLCEGGLAVIKEPFFKVTTDGSYSLRVDHVSDIVWLPYNDDEGIRQKWRSRIHPSIGTKVFKTSHELRADGNEAVKNKQWAEALSR
jgi:hypothetical protein